MSGLTIEAPPSPTAETELLLAEVLADVMQVDTVSPDSDLFDELGLDSMVLAHFCARLRKRDDVPSLSIKEVYQHSTISSLAMATTLPKPSSEPAPEIVYSAPATSVGDLEYVLCGALQLLATVAYLVLIGWVASTGYEWVAATPDFGGLYVRSAVFGGATFIALSTIPIAAKWILVGRWKRGRFRIWSFGYLRFWMVKSLIRTNPLVLFAGTPIYVLYLRALGATVGRRAVILTRNVPICTDLLTIADDVVVRKDSFLNCYRARGGFIETGEVTLGMGSVVGEMTVLDIDTRLGDGAQLGHASALDAGQVIAAGQHKVGTPATTVTTADYAEVPPTERSAQRRAGYAAAQLLFLFGVSLPVPASIFVALAEWRISPIALASESREFFGWTIFAEALLFAAVLFFGLAVAALMFAMTVPRLLNLAIKRGVAYPLYGVRHWSQRVVARSTNLKFFTTLFGDTSYIVHYLRWLGYDVSLDGQTGANFGLNVKHDNPYHVSVGAGTMAADGLSIINVDYSSTSFRVSPAAIGSNSFIGNNVAYPSQAKTGDDCLHASKVLVPTEGEVREHIGLLGSPSFEIPRLVLRDQRFDDMRHGDVLRRGLAAKNAHNRRTIAWFLLSRYAVSFILILLAFGAAEYYVDAGMLVVPAASILVGILAVLYLILVERASTGFKRLGPAYCSLYELDNWRFERFWKLSFVPSLLNGTPFKSIVWRLLGVRIGKRVFDDGCLMIEKTMISVGDECTLNSGSVIQPHSQEDGALKADFVTIGNGCTLGVGSLVHYGTVIGDGAILGPHAFLMKGAEVPAGTYWADNPATHRGVVATEPEKGEIT